MNSAWIWSSDRPIGSTPLPDAVTGGTPASAAVSVTSTSPTGTPMGTETGTVIAGSACPGASGDAGDRSWVQLTSAEPATVAAQSQPTPVGADATVTPAVRAAVTVTGVVSAPPVGDAAAVSVNAPKLPAAIGSALIVTDSSVAAARATPTLAATAQRATTVAVKHLRGRIVSHPVPGCVSRPGASFGHAVSGEDDAYGG